MTDNIKTNAGPLAVFVAVGKLSGQCNPELGLRAAFRRLRIFLYAAVYPRAALHWFRSLATDPVLASLSLRDRRFPERPFHTFGTKNLTATQRATIIAHHYGVAYEKLGNELFSCVYERDEVAILASYGPYQLVIRQVDSCRREGLLSVAWRHKECNVDLVRATLSFERSLDTGQCGVLVGGLQGPTGNTADARQLIREATKACHGLRPKSVVMEGILMVARIAPFARVRAVSNRTHVGRSRNKAFVADYDGFWRELGGRDHSGIFSIPPVLPHRSLNDVPSGKRAAFRRRGTLLADIDAQMSAALAADTVTTSQKLS
ncbi:VirK/YbjX family protein [Paraburkholderia aspalathi]|uniref:VirK/YbjX family protein n=1 Tax=Paraburkholderia aspalathi TaxID=1324617 RepID=UPI0038B92E24